MELAPNYTSFDIYGAYGVRHHDRSTYYGWWGGRDTQLREDSLQIVPLSSPDVDRAEPVATIEIPAHAQTYRVQDKLVVVSTIYEPPTDSAVKEGNYLSTVDVWDMSMPAMPALLSSTQTTRLQGARY